MGAIAVRVSRPTAAVLAPLLVRQGELVRRRTPVLPEAAGPRRGVEGSGPELQLTVLGESPAAGVGVERQDQGLARHLAVELAARTGRSVHWRVVARTGATAGHTLRTLVPLAVQEPSDLVVVVLGVNDTLKLQPARRWRATIGALLDQVRPSLHPGGVVLLAGIPRMGQIQSLPQPLRVVLGLHARGLDRVLGQVARRRSDVVHAPSPTLGGPEAFAVDGFHPGAATYRQWAAHLAAAAVPLLRP